MTIKNWDKIPINSPVTTRKALAWKNSLTNRYVAVLPSVRKGGGWTTYIPMRITKDFKLKSKAVAQTHHYMKTHQGAKR
jgi:hypothetical protein